MKQITEVIWICSMVYMFLAVSVNARTTDEWEQKEHAWKQKADDAYEFPVKPGTLEWRALGSTQARRDVLQIPEDILRTLSIEGLVETCLNYPFLGDIAAYNNPQYGLGKVVARFNCLQELLRREGSGSALLESYKTLNPDHEYEKWRATGDVNTYHLSFLGIEALLAHKPIVFKMSSATKIMLLQESLRVYQAKLRSEHYANYTLNAPVFIMARILEHASPQALKEQMERLKKEDTEIIRQRILQNHPEMGNIDFEPISRSGAEKYQVFLDSGGMIVLDGLLLPLIVESAEQYLAGIQLEGKEHEN